MRWSTPPTRSSSRSSLRSRPCSVAALSPSCPSWSPTRRSTTDSDDLVWPSDPETCKSRPSLTPPLRRFGASSANLSALHRVHCLAVRRIPLRPVHSQLLVCLCFKFRPCPCLPAPSRACNPCDSGLAWADAAFTVCSSGPGSPVCCGGFRCSVRAVLSAHASTQPYCASAVSSILRLGSDSVRGILAAMVLAGATPTASSVIANVIIPPAQLSVRGRMTL